MPSDEVAADNMMYDEPTNPFCGVLSGTAGSEPSLNSISLPSPSSAIGDIILASQCALGRGRIHKEAGRLVPEVMYKKTRGQPTRPGTYTPHSSNLSSFSTQTPRLPRARPRSHLASVQGNCVSAALTVVSSTLYCPPVVVTLLYFLGFCVPYSSGVVQSSYPRSSYIMCIHPCVYTPYRPFLSSPTYAPLLCLGMLIHFLLNSMVSDGLS
jgi:hypothetical protein